MNALATPLPVFLHPPCPVLLSLNSLAPLSCSSLFRSPSPSKEKRGWEELQEESSERRGKEMRGLGMRGEWTG